MDDIFFNQWRMSASSITLPNIYSSWYVWLIIHYCISYNLQIDWPQRHTVTLLENRYTIKRLITLLWIYTLLGVLQPKEPWYPIILIHFSVDIDQYFNHFRILYTWWCLADRFKRLSNWIYQSESWSYFDLNTKSFLQNKEELSQLSVCLNLTLCRSDSWCFCSVGSRKVNSDL